MLVKESLRHAALWTKTSMGPAFNKDLKFHVSSNNIMSSTLGTAYELPSGVDPGTFLVGFSATSVSVHWEVLVMQGNVAR